MSIVRSGRWCHMHGASEGRVMAERNAWPIRVLGSVLPPLKLCFQRLLMTSTLLVQVNKETSAIF